MTNLLNELVYITLANARDTSNVLPAAPTLTDALLTKLITEAQWIIDDYIISFGTKVDDDQSFIFPTEDDGVPEDIQLATIRITEQLYLQGNPTASSLKGDKITSESNISRSVSYSDKQSYSNYVDTIGIPKKALNVLNKYKNNFTSQVI